MSCCSTNSSRRKQRSPILPFLAIVFVAAILLGTCRSNEKPSTSSTPISSTEQVKALQKAAEELAAQTPSLTRVNTEWNFGETVSAVTGYYDGDHLRMIEEQMNMGGRGTASNRYFYDPAGKLYAYEEKKEIKAGSNGASPATEQSELRLYFSDSGELISSTRSVAGKSEPLLGIEEQTVRMHSRELEAALTDALAKEHGASH